MTGVDVVYNFHGSDSNSFTSIAYSFGSLALGNLPKLFAQQQPKIQDAHNQYL
jgi:hypothetical protein